MDQVLDRNPGRRRQIGKRLHRVLRLGGGNFLREALMLGRHVHTTSLVRRCAVLRMAAA
ncbi:MAG: hypothetical protein WA862_14160 [Solirubrobacterales bacterium]